jgi:hypothetical protein
MISRVPKSEQKIQGYVPLYNIWALQGLVDAGHVGVNRNDAVSNIVIQWFHENKKLLEECRLTTADFVKAMRKRGSPQNVVQFPELPQSAPESDEGKPVDRSARRVVACPPLPRRAVASGRRIQSAPGRER